MEKREFFYAVNVITFAWNGYDFHFANFWEFTVVMIELLDYRVAFSVVLEWIDKDMEKLCVIWFWFIVVTCSYFVNRCLTFFVLLRAILVLCYLDYAHYWIPHAHFLICQVIWNLQNRSFPQISQQIAEIFEYHIP